MIKIILFSLSVLFWDLGESYCPPRNDLGRQRSIKLTEGPQKAQKIFTPLCINLESSDVCYSGGFSRANEWNLGIVLSEQTKGNIDSRQETMPYPFTSKDGFKNVNNCMGVKKPKICFVNYNPFRNEKGIVWKLQTPTIKFTRISTRSSLLQRFGRFFTDGSHYSDVTGSLDLSWNNKINFNSKLWHGAFQLFRNGEQPMAYPFSSNSLRYDDRESNSKIKIENVRVIFSEHPDDVLSWDMTPLTFVGTSSFEENIYFDSNSQPLRTLAPAFSPFSTGGIRDVCFTNIPGDVCILDPEGEQSSIAAINFNIGEGKSNQNLPIYNASQRCLPTILKKVCMHENLQITTDVSSLPYEDPWVVNTLYFVSSFLPLNKSGKFFCSQFNGTICFNSRLGVGGRMVSSIDLHQKDKYPQKRKGSIMDVHQCLRTCPFDICFTENNNGSQWILKSTFYFTKIKDPFF